MNVRTVALGGILALTLTMVGSSASLASRQSAPDDTRRQQVAWVVESLGRMEQIKVGMTRADLFKVFTMEGGLYTPTWGHYVFRDCPYFKVDVEFEPVGPGTRGPTLTGGSDADIIKVISKPYIQRMIID